MVRTTEKPSSTQVNSQNEGDPGMGSSPESMPRDANIISLILKHMDVYEYDTRVVPQLLEFAYRYIQDILQDSQVYAEHAGRTETLTDDVKLAIQAKVNISFTAPPSREFLLQLAEKMNGQPLPLITEKIGVRLPPEKYCLTAPNYQIDPKATLESWKQNGSTITHHTMKRESEGIKVIGQTKTSQEPLEDQSVMFGLQGSLTRANVDEDYDMEDTS